MNKPSCYICGTFAGQYHKQVTDRYSIYKCLTCGLEYTYPVPQDEEIKAFYFQYKDFRADREIVELNAKEHLKTLEKYGWTPDSKMLDFGTGDGVFVEIAGGNTFGIDMKPSDNPRIKSSLEGAWEDVNWDFITLFGVLEHLPSPLQTMRNLLSRLQMNGVIAVTTVDAEGVIPYYYKPPEHLTYWTRSAFEAMCKVLNLRIIEYTPYKMFQLGKVYLERLLSRTPEEYQELIVNNLPRVVYVPTNEVRCLLQKNG